MSGDQVAVKFSFLRGECSLRRLVCRCRAYDETIKLFLIFFCRSEGFTLCISNKATAKKKLCLLFEANVYPYIKITHPPFTTKSSSPIPHRRICLTRRFSLFVTNVSHVPEPRCFTIFSSSPYLDSVSNFI